MHHVLTIFAVLVSSSSFAAPAPNASVKDFLKTENVTYQIRYGADLEQTPSGTRTLLCQEGSLSDDIIQRDDLGKPGSGYLTVKYKDLLDATIAVDLDGLGDSKGAPSLYLTSHFYPQVKPRIGYPLGTTQTSNYNAGKDEAILSSVVLENGTVFKSPFVPSNIKEYTITVVVNPPAAMNCAHYLNR